MLTRIIITIIFLLPMIREDRIKQASKAMPHVMYFKTNLLRFAAITVKKNPFVNAVDSLINLMRSKGHTDTDGPTKETMVR